MTTPFHMVVWIDHQSAHLHAFASGGDTTIHNGHAGDAGHIHHRAGTVGAGHAGIDETFLKKVADAVGEAREILIVGPAQAKFELKKFIELHLPGMAARIVGVEPMDQARDSEIENFARRFFTHADSMMPSK